MDVLKTAMVNAERVAVDSALRIEERVAQRLVPMAEDALELSKAVMAKAAAAGKAVEGKLAHQVKRFKPPTERPTGRKLAKFHEQLLFTRAAETVALAKLTPRQQGLYQELAALVSFRADGRMALRQLLLDGRLTAPSRYADNKDILTQLQHISRMDLAEGINRRTYLSEVLQEINNPNLVCQEAKGTCAATTARSMLVRDDPAEYLRLQRGLISPRGEVRLRDDNLQISDNPKKRLRRKDDWQAEDGGRTVSARVQEPAAMQYAYEMHSYRYIYDNEMDLKILPTGPDPELDGGLMNHELHHLLKGYFPGSRWQSIILPFSDREKAAKGLLVKVGRLATLETPVTVGMEYRKNGPHQIAVTGVLKDRVEFYNPQVPSLESMDRLDFQNRLLDAVLPKVAR